MTSGEIDVRARTERPDRLPLRGLFAWGLGAGFFFLAFLQRVSPSVMVDELMRDFAVSAVILGNLSACYFYIYAAMQLPVGLMIDRIGPRLLLTLFALLCVAGNLIFAVADTVTAAYLGRILIGAGAAASWVGTLALATRWLPARHFALFAGLGQVFGMAGGVFGQSPLSLAVDGLGWRGALLATAGLAGLFAVLFWLVVRDHPPGDGQRQHVPRVVHGSRRRRHGRRPRLLQRRQAAVAHWRYEQQRRCATRMDGHRLRPDAAQLAGGIRERVEALPVGGRAIEGDDDAAGEVEAGQVVVAQRGRGDREAREGQLASSPARRARW